MNFYEELVELLMLEVEFASKIQVICRDWGKFNLGGKF